MELNKFLSASGGHPRRQEEAGSSDEAGVNEDLDFVQMYLTCLPERYMKAKFTLTAYLACWLILKLCKRAWEKRSPASQKVPEPVENCTSEGELEEDRHSSGPNTLELEIRGSGQETDEDYFETQSHQSESLSDIKTEPYESASDSESVGSDATRETSLSSYCLSSEIEEPWHKSPETKVEIVASKLECRKQLGSLQKEAVKLPSVLHVAASKSELEVVAPGAKTEGFDGKEKTLPYSIPYAGSKTSTEDFVSQTEAMLIAEAKLIDNETHFHICSKNLAEGALGKGDTSAEATTLAGLRANSESSLSFLDVHHSPVPSEGVSRYSLPNIHLETNRTWKRNCESSKVRYKQAYIPNAKCNRKDVTASQKAAGANLCERKQEATGSPCLKSAFQVSPKRPGTLEMKSWHSSPGSISAQEVREHANDCICLVDKLSWSCSRLPLEVSDYGHGKENLESCGGCPQNSLTMGKDIGIEELLLNTHPASNKSKLMQASNSHWAVSRNLHNNSKNYGLKTKRADTLDCASLALSQHPGPSEGNSKQETCSTLACVPTNINAKVVLRKDQSTSVSEIEIKGFPQDLGSKSNIHGAEAQENLLGGCIMADKSDNTCGIHASTVRKEVNMLRKCLETQNTEAFVGATERRNKSGFNIDWGVLDGMLASNGKDFTEHEVAGLQDMSKRSSAFKRPSSPERTNVHLMNMERKDCYCGSGEVVSALEPAPKPHCICQGEKSESKSLLLQSLGQKGLESKKIRGENNLGGLATEILECQNVASHLITTIDSTEPQETSNAQNNCANDILPVQVMSGCESELHVRTAFQESTKNVHKEAEATVLDLSSVVANSTGASIENDSCRNNLSLENAIQTQKEEAYPDGLFLEPHGTRAEILLVKPCQVKAGTVETTQVANLQLETRGPTVVVESMTTNVEQDFCVSTAKTQERNSGLCQDATAGDKTHGSDVCSKQILEKGGTKSCDIPHEEIGFSPVTGLNRGITTEDPECIGRGSEWNPNSDICDSPVKMNNQDNSTTGLDNVSMGSTNSEEMDESVFNFLGSNNSFYKAVHRNSKAGATEKPAKHLKFLAFSKMASFRKSKLTFAENQDSIKTEILDGDKGDEVEEGLKSISSSSPAFQSEYSDDDDLFYERPVGLFNRISLRKASSSGRTLLEAMGTGSSPVLAQMKCSEGKVLGSAENYSHESVEYPELRKSSSENDFKRNKNTESKKFRSRLALAHRSFSSFFESRTLEKENAEQSPKIAMKNEKEKAKLAQTSWKAFLKSKEADGLKRSALTSSLPTRQSPCSNRSPGSFARRASKEKQECHNGQFFLKSSVSNGSATEAGHSDSSGTGDVQPLDIRRRRREPSHELTINCPQSSECNGKEEATGQDGDASFDEFWLKSPLSPIDLQSSFSHYTPSCPQLSMYERKDMPCRPMSPKPQSPRTSSQRKGFHYPGRLSSTSMISLGNISVIDGNLEAPERPKTLKPRSSFLQSMHSLDNDYLREDSGISSQSQISLNTTSSVSDIRDEENIQQNQIPSEKRPGEKRGLHCRKRSTQMPLSPHSFSTIEDKAWGLPFHVQEGKAKEHAQRKRRRPLYKRFSFDDTWMERNRKRKLVKETQSDRENESCNLPGDQLQVKTRPSITSPVAFGGLPLKLHLYSQSTPTGLDCVGLRRRISFPGSRASRKLHK